VHELNLDGLHNSVISSSSDQRPGVVEPARIQSLKVQDLEMIFLMIVFSQLTLHLLSESVFSKHYCCNTSFTAATKDQ